MPAQALSVYEQAAEAWRGVGFSKVQKSLDEQATKIDEYQRHGTETRQELASKTREFRKLDPEQRTEQIKPLLKRYQQEIDELTNRCKFAESCFISCYGSIGDISDPLLIIEAAAAEHKKLIKLERVAAELEAAKAQLASQSDYNQLKEQIQEQQALFEITLASQASTAAVEHAKALEAQKEASDEVVRELNCQITDLKQALQVAEAQLKLSGDGPAAEQIQLPEHRAMVRELERATTKVQELSLKNAQLTHELKKSSDNQSSGAEAVADKINQLEAENAKLESRLATIADKQRAEMEDMQQRLSKAEQQQKQVASELQLAQSELAIKQDYDQLKTEVASLRQMEFGDLEPDTDESRLFEARNARLEKQLVDLRLLNSAQQEQLSQSQSKIERLEAAVEQASKAVAQLESELSAVTVRDDQSIVSVDPSNDAVIAILSQQRDRYKDRAAELEKETRRVATLLATQRKELATIKNDNKELYERLRYVEQHGQERQQGLGNRDRFRSAYEDGLASFQQFKDLETERALAGRGKADRALFAFVKRFVTNDKFRLGVLCYAGLVHIVLIVLLM